MKTIKDTPRAEERPTHKVVFNQIQQRMKDIEDEAVVYCEKEYPETCKEFKQSICELIHSDWEKIAKSKEGKLSRIQIDETSRNKRYGRRN